MSLITVDIAGLEVTNDATDVLVTYALGSCVAVIVYDPVQQHGGMIHYMLPLSKLNPEKARTSPAMFADTGVPLLFTSMYSLGTRKEDLVVKVVGGGQIHDENGVFEIGKRNYMILRKMLWKNNVVIAAEDVGGTLSRTVRLHVDSGRVLIRSQQGEVEL